MSAALVVARAVKYVLDLNGKSISVEQPIFRVGRGEDNDLVLDDVKVSRYHAEIRVEKGLLYIKNTSGKNFVLVDGQSIDEKLLEKNHTIILGDSELRLKIESSAAMTPIDNPGLRAIKSSSSASPELISQKGGVQKPISTFAGNRSQPQSGAMKSTPYADVQPLSPSKSSGSRTQFYAILVVVGIVVLWLMSSETGGKKQTIDLRNEAQVQRSIEESVAAVQQMQAQQEAKGKETLQYQMAEQHYIKGFRDYRQGQYARAMQSFQAALSFFPQHELARKYWTLSKRKFDELVQFNMNQGRRYLGKNNFRLCRNSFANVMIMLRDPNDPIYKEAKQFHDECQIKQEGVF